MNSTLADSSSEEKIVLDITCFHDQEVLNEQSLTGCDHSGRNGVLMKYLSINGVFTSNGRVKGNFVCKNFANLTKRKPIKAKILILSKGSKFVPSSNHINKAKVKIELETYGRMLRLKWHFRNDDKEFDRNSLCQNPRLILKAKMQQMRCI